MSILKNDADVNRAAVESGVMFDADDHTDMASVTTKQFGAWIGLNVEDGDEDESTDGDQKNGLRQHAEKAKRARNRARAHAAAPNTQI